MKAVLVFLVSILFLIGTINSQIKIPDFEFGLYFRNAEGFHDTINLGVDLKFTDFERRNYGMEDIRTKTIQKELDVRITFSITTPWAEQYKRNINPYNCHDPFLTGPIRGMPFPHRIGFQSSSFPITIKWNKDLFKDTCYYKSFLTRIDWSSFDFFEPWMLFTPAAFLAQVDSFTFTKEYLENSNYKDFARTNYDPIVLSDGTSSVWYQFFIGITGQPLTILLGANDTYILNSQIKLKNPIIDNFNLNLIELEATYDELIITNISGNIIYQQALDQTRGVFHISTVMWDKGIYIVALRSKSGKLISSKLIKL